VGVGVGAAVGVAVGVEVGAGVDVGVGVGPGVGVGVGVGFADEAGGAEALGLGLVPLVDGAAFADSANHVQETPRGPVSASR
jgi:hypothetical protein